MYSKEDHKSVRRLDSEILLEQRLGTNINSSYSFEFAPRHTCKEDHLEVKLNGNLIAKPGRPSLEKSLSEQIPSKWKRRKFSNISALEVVTEKADAMRQHFLEVNSHILKKQVDYNDYVNALGKSCKWIHSFWITL